MAKQTKTQSFNADDQTINLLNRVKKYRMKKDAFIREAIYSYYKETILPFELRLSKEKKYKDCPF